MKHRHKILLLAIIYTLLFLNVMSQPTNIDFGFGNINGWNFSHGDNINSITMTTGTLSASAEYSIMTTSGTSGTEINNIPITMSSPLGGAFIRIGQMGSGGQAYILSQTFHVDASSTALAISSAFIEEDGGHICSEQPYFDFLIKDANGLIIPSSDSYVALNSVSCTSGEPNYLSYNNTSTGIIWSYLPWQNRSFDLTNYIGTNVTIEFSVAGCAITQGAHPGYAYVDAALCTNNFLPTSVMINNNLYSLVQSSSTINLCNNYPITIVAPNGATTYSWTGGSLSGLNSQSVVVNQSGTYNMICDKASACTNTTSVTFKVDTVMLVTVSSNSLVCSGQTTTLTASGATSYTWNNGVNSSHIIVTPMTTTNYTVTGSDFYGCIGSNTMQVIVTANPTISVVSAGTVCVNSSLNLSANGASTYSWSFGAITPSVSITPLSNAIYTVTGTNLNNCSSTQTVSVIVDNTCQDVWPGDANSDGTADNLDVLELGLHYTQTGSSRAITSNVWQSFHADNWVGTISNGKNLNHSDCNGDGTIDDSDTFAIFNNYGLIHAFKVAQTNTINPLLSIVPDQASVLKGTWGTASIYLGDATTSINNINGVAFTVDFDNTLIEPSSIWIEYLPSFIDASQNLHFRKLDFANGKVFAATTHTINNNVSGFGKIATLHYQIKSSLTTDQVLNIGLSQANQSDASGTIIPLTTGTGTLMALGASVGLQELNRNVVSISPNPTNGSLLVNSKTELQKIEVLSVDGKVLVSETPTNVSHTLYLENFANGIYFVNLYQNNRVVKREKVVLNK